MRESERVSRAREAYESAKSEEGLPGPPGIEYEGVPDEMAGSGYEKGAGVHRGEFVPPEERDRQPSVAEAAAERLDIWDPETETIDADMAHAVILDIEDPEQRKAALKALAEYEETQLQKVDHPEIVPGVTTQKEVVTAVAKSPAAKPRGEKRGPRKPRMTEYERKMQKFSVQDANSLRGWFKEKTENPGSRRWLFMDARSWEEIDTIQNALDEMRSEINAIEWDRDRDKMRRLWVTAVDKLEHNKIALRKKGVRDTRPKVEEKAPVARKKKMRKPRPKTPRPEAKPKLEVKGGRIRVNNEEELNQWVDRQRQMLEKGEKDEAKLVIMATSEDGLRVLKEIVGNMRDRWEKMPEEHPKKERERQILRKVQGAYRSARWFVRSRDAKEAKPATLADKKKKWQQKGKTTQPKQIPKREEGEAREDVV